MSTFILPSLEKLKREQHNKVYGVCVAIVTKNKDDEGKYRVRVRFPWLSNGGASGGEESTWCRIATIGAGKDRGFYWLPEVGDEVLVAFEHGDVDRPFVVGSLWNKDMNVFQDNKGGKNNSRTMKSRSGHTLDLGDDAEGKAEKVEIKTKAGHRLCLDDKDGGNKIELYDKSGKNYLTVDTEKNTITLNSEKDILIKAKEKISLQAKTIETKSDQDTTMKVGGNFKMEASSNFTVKGSGSGTIESSGTLTIKGSTVNIN